MSSQRARHKTSPRPLATLLLTPLACALCSAANAGEFNWGEVSGRYNGSLSIGGVWSAEKPSADNIFQGNADVTGYGKPGEFNANGGRTGDDGRLAWPEIAPADQTSTLKITSQTSLRLLVYASPIFDEPIAMGGPFVMNNQEEIIQAFMDLQTGKFIPT